MFKESNQTVNFSTEEEQKTRRKQRRERKCKKRKNTRRKSCSKKREKLKIIKNHLIFRFKKIVRKNEEEKVPEKKSSYRLQWNRLEQLDYWAKKLRCILLCWPMRLSWDAGKRRIFLLFISYKFQSSKKSNHAFLQSIMNRYEPEVPLPCCVPDKLAPLSILYNEESSQHVVLKVYPNMSVLSCSCRWGSLHYFYSIFNCTFNNCKLSTTCTVKKRKKIRSRLVEFTGEELITTTVESSK